MFHRHRPLQIDVLDEDSTSGGKADFTQSRGASPGDWSILGENLGFGRCTIPVAVAAAAKTEGVNGAFQPVAKHGFRLCAQFSDDEAARILQRLDFV